MRKKEVCFMFSEISLPDKIKALGEILPESNYFHDFDNEDFKELNEVKKQKEENYMKYIKSFEDENPLKPFVSTPAFQYICSQKLSPEVCNELINNFRFNDYAAILSIRNQRQYCLAMLMLAENNKIDKEHLHSLVNTLIYRIPHSPIKDCLANYIKTWNKNPSENPDINENRQNFQKEFVDTILNFTAKFTKDFSKSHQGYVFYVCLSGIKDNDFLCKTVRFFDEENSKGIEEYVRGKVKEKIFNNEYFTDVDLKEKMISEGEMNLKNIDFSRCPEHIFTSVYRSVVASVFEMDFNIDNEFNSIDFADEKQVEEMNAYYMSKDVLNQMVKSGEISNSIQYDLINRLCSLKYTREDTLMTEIIQSTKNTKTLKTFAEKLGPTLRYRALCNPICSTSEDLLRLRNYDIAKIRNNNFRDDESKKFMLGMINNYKYPPTEAFYNLINTASSSFDTYEIQAVSSEKIPANVLDIYINTENRAIKNGLTLNKSESFLYITKIINREYAEENVQKVKPKVSRKDVCDMLFSLNLRKKELRDFAFPSQLDEFIPYRRNHNYTSALFPYRRFYKQNREKEDIPSDYYNNEDIKKISETLNEIKRILNEKVMKNKAMPPEVLEAATEFICIADYITDIKDILYGKNKEINSGNKKKSYAEAQFIANLLTKRGEIFINKSITCLDFYNNVEDFANSAYPSYISVKNYLNERNKENEANKDEEEQKEFTL